MAIPVEGGDLIRLVDVTQDFCANVYGEENDGTNIIRQSETFEAPGWELQNCEAERLLESGFDSGAQLGPSTVVRTGSTFALFGQDFTATNTIDYTFSIFVRENTVDKVNIRLFAGTAQSLVDFDLTAETATATVGGINETPLNSAITDVGGGIYRISVGRTCNADSTGRVDVTFATNADGYSDGDRIDADCAQLEVATAGPTAYSPQIGYGSCTASLSADNPNKCFNTFATCQDTPNYQRGSLRLRFAPPQQDLPTDGFVYPLLKSITTAPSRLNTTSRSRNEPLGQRASMTATFIDAPSTDKIVDKYADERVTGAAQFSGVGYDPVDRGTFWGKWIARNPYWLGRPIKSLQGVIEPGQFDQLTERHYLIEKITGPDVNGRVTITGKDPLKLADNDRAQAPIASQGELDADINDSVTTATLAPTGIGDTDYPASGTLVIGSEIMTFTRSSDTLTLVRAQGGTTAASHSAGDTVQLCTVYDGDLVSDIVYDLLVNYAGIDTDLIPKTDWDDEAALYIPNGYSTIIPKPTAVKNLIGELSEQAGFSIWWDEVDQIIKLAAVKQPGVGARAITDDWIIKGSLSVKERPDARLSEVWTNYGTIDYTGALDNPNNYRATQVTIDADAGGPNEYGQTAVRKINSRWINVAGKAAALDANERLLSRFRDIFREIKFAIPSYRADEIRMGDIHLLQTRYLQDALGDPEMIPIRIMAVEQSGDTLKIDTEETLFFAPPDDATHLVIFGGDDNTVNLRDAYDDQFPSGPQPTTDIVFRVDPGVVIGGADLGDFSIDVGSWGDLTFNSLSIVNYGTISGRGGNGGKGGDSFQDGDDGEDGSTAFYTRQAITVDNQGIIQGGGGGGGGGGYDSLALGGTDGGNGGGGGAGRVIGGGAVGGSGSFNNGEAGEDGTLTTGGAGGDKTEGRGGRGGNPGQAGSSGKTVNGAGGSGGAAGDAVDGDSFVTYATIGTITGAQVN